MNIAVLGAGAWGTALATSTCRQHAVCLWSRDAAHCDALQTEQENSRYLPGVALPAALQITADLDQACAKADLILVATPVSGLRPLLQHLSTCSVPVVWVCKGFEIGQQNCPGLLPHEVQTQVAPNLRCGVLSGPSFALEVARAQPTALVAASPHDVVRQVLVAAFHSPSLRVYANEDWVGVEVGGAVKNVLAIATGLCDGLGVSGLGLNARAALITRGLAEMTRLGLALGARADTFMGLSGLGDLVLTATGHLSRNRQVGIALAQGQTLEQATASLGHVAEGVYCARTVVERAVQQKIEMPIASTVVALLNGQFSPQQALQQLMAREARSE